MGNCLKNSIPSKPAQETEARKRRIGENKCKKVHFDEHVEVFGRGCGEDEEEEEQRKESKVGIKEQVRIRITKKQFEELLGKVELESLTVHEMMSCLVKEHLNELKEDDSQKPSIQNSNKTPEPAAVNVNNT